MRRDSSVDELGDLGSVRARVASSEAQSCDFLLGLQEDDGHWCGELAGDTILESELILLMCFLGRLDDPRCRKAAEQIRRQQIPGSAWAIYPGGPAEVSASVKSYFVLKLLGDDPAAEHMRAAREAIRALGGIDAVNTYTKIYLAMFGQYDWERCPAVPPEMLLLPDWAPIHVRHISSWSRGIFVPLTIVWAHKPRVAVPVSIDELVVSDWVRPTVKLTMEAHAYRTICFGIDWTLRVLERNSIQPFRARALDAARAWVEERLERSDGLAAIFPAFVNAILALKCLGYADDHPSVKSQLEALERHYIEDGETLRVQPCKSPVWDTSQAMNALLACGLDPGHRALERAARWLVDREVRTEGDWRGNLEPDCDVEPSGWYFEYANEFYPDCDDTAEVLAVLARVEVGDRVLRERITAARQRAVRWLLAMQNDDGGWGAFDRNCNSAFLTHVPFADHNAMIDPSWEDITGRILDMLAGEGFDRSHPAVAHAIEFLLAKQEPDGTWYGRWGANYFYGTWLVLAGLERMGVDLSEPRHQCAAQWIRAHQNADGGWGESLLSYDDPSQKGCGPSTAAQSAWALLSLFATGDFRSDAVRRGVEFLLASQENGTWKDEHWTGTGFPRVFYLHYHYYDDYFPLIALAEYRRYLDAHVEPEVRLRAAL